MCHTVSSFSFLLCTLLFSLFDNMNTDRQQLQLIERLNARCSFPVFTPERTCIEIKSVSFYTHFRLLKATAFNTIPPVTMHFLIDEDNQVVKLDGTNEPILKNNARGGLILNENTVVAYTRFILDAVQTEQGSLRLVEHFQEDEIITSTPTPQHLELLRDNIRPTHVATTPQGFLLDAIILYGDTMFQADIFVEPDGNLCFRSETPIAEHLPIRPILLE